MAIGNTGAIGEGIDKLFELSYHPKLKVFGANVNISSMLDDESLKEGLINKYENSESMPEKLPFGSTIIYSGDGHATVHTLESQKKYNDIIPIENKFYVRNLIKQGYKRI